MLDPVKLADGVWPLAPARVLRRQFLWWRAVLDPNPTARPRRAPGLRRAGPPGIMGGMPEVDQRRRSSPTSPSASRTAAHAVPWSRPQSWVPTLVGALLGSLAVCLFGRAPEE